mgnify:CR=1 FL=1
MRDLYVWMRVGDQGDYESFNSVDEAGYDLAQYLDPDACYHDVRRYKGPALTGIEVGCYVGYDAVSLYWGDDDAQLEAELNHQELACLAATLHCEMAPA